MKGFEAVVGVDVSKDSLSVTILRGKKEQTFTSENEGKAFESSLSKALKDLERPRILVVMESTGVYHLKLASYLQGRGYGVSVVNPFVIKKYSEMRMKRTKTDAVDSRIIAEYGRSAEDIKLFTPKKEVQQAMEIKLKTIEDFYKQINALQNQLAALEHVPACTSKLKKPYEKAMKLLIEEIGKIEKDLIKISREYYPEEVRILKSVPGIGNRLSCIIVSMLGSFEGFERGKQITSYLGICPSPYESGVSVKRRGHILKKGNPYIRKILYICALSASRYNKTCRLLFERLVLKGKNKRLALIAVANKLIRQAFAVLKTKTLYNEDYLLVKGA
jgi:transposase